MTEVSTLLDAAYGERDEVDVAGYRFASRPVPSAGARYGLEIHLIVRAVTGLEPGTFRYLPPDHALQQTSGGSCWDRVCDLFLGQSYLASASAVAVLTADLDATLPRYGDRSYRYLLLEAGHVAQNVNLASGALGLGCLNLGGFLDQTLGTALGLTGEVPLYGIALGRPSAPDVQGMRQPSVPPL